MLFKRCYDYDDIFYTFFVNFKQNCLIHIHSFYKSTFQFSIEIHSRVLEYSNDIDTIMDVLGAAQHCTGTLICESLAL